MRAGVVGAGLMGAEIALVFALAGHEVLLHDRSDDALAEAIKRLRGILDKGVSREFYSPEAAEAALTRIRPVSALAAMADRMRSDFIGISFRRRREDRAAAVPFGVARPARCHRK